MLLSAAGVGVPFSEAGGVEADTELWFLSERVDSEGGREIDNILSKFHYELW